MKFVKFFKNINCIVEIYTDRHAVYEDKYRLPPVIMTICVPLDESNDILKFVILIRKHPVLFFLSRGKFKSAQYTNMELTEP